MNSSPQNRFHELLQRGSWRRRLGLFSLFLLLAGIPFLVYRSYVDRRHYERSLLRLSRELQTDRLSQRELEREVAGARSELSRYRTETEAALARLQEEKQRLQEQVVEAAQLLEQRGQRIGEVESQLAVATRKIQEIESGREVAQQVIGKYLPGVAYVEVAYTFEDGKGRKIRFEKVDFSGEPVTDAAGEASVSVEAGGPVVHIRSSGSGFLIGENKLLTNRHVVEPWMQNKAARPFLKKGFRAMRTLLRAFFPGVKKAFVMRVARLSEETDLALLEFEPQGIRLPVLQLERDAHAAQLGRPIILIGYPAGVESLLARVDPVTLKKIKDLRGSKVVAITDDLSQEGLIRPLVTWGHLSEIRQHQLTYDALTTAGGSGSPILNIQGKVIGINQAMLKSFAGSSFGIPARLALEFIGEAAKAKR